MALGERMRSRVTALRLTAANMAAGCAEPEAGPTATLLASVSSWCGAFRRGVLAGGQRGAAALEEVHA